MAGNELLAAVAACPGMAQLISPTSKLLARKFAEGYGEKKAHFMVTAHPDNPLHAVAGSCAAAAVG